MLCLHENSVFENEVLCSEKPVLVDFTADWSSSCRMQAPILEDLNFDHGAEITIRKVDVDTASHLASKYKIAAVPTMLLFKDGEIKETLVGLSSLQELEEAVERVLWGDSYGCCTT